MQQVAIERPIPATYVTVWDDKIVCEFSCNYYPSKKEVTDIKSVDAYVEIAEADAMTDEYVRLDSGVILRKIDGIIFGH